MAIEDPAEQNAMLETTSFSFLPAFTAVALEFGQSITNGLGKPVTQMEDGSITLSTKGGPSSWKIGDDIYASFSMGAQQATYDPTINAVGYDVDSQYFMFSGEKFVSDRFSLGVFAGYADGSSEADLDRGSLDASGGFVGGFARAAFGDGGTAQFMLGYQDLTFDTERNVMGSTAVASTGGQQVFAALDADYMFGKEQFRFGPTGSLEMYHVSVNDFEESGAGAWNLNVSDLSGNVVIASVGMRGEYTMSSGPQSAKLSGALKYNKVTGSDKLVQIGLAGLPSSASPSDGFDMNWVTAEIGIDLPLSTSGPVVSSLRAGISGTYASGYESHELQISFNAKF